MIQIDIDVRKNHCSVKHLNMVTSGCVNTVICNFAFSDDWSSYTKIASFERDGITYHAQILDNHCIVPNAAINSSGVFSVGIVGIDSDNDRTITTNLLNIRIIDGADKVGELDPDYSPTFLENVVSALSEAKSIAQSVRDDADAGKFDGKTPIKGLDYFTPSEIEGIKNAAKSVIELNAEAYRHNRDIVLTQDGEEVGRVTAAGQKNGQSWLFTDYTNSRVSGDFSSSFGFNNRIFGNGNSVFGIRNILTGRGVVLAGTGNTVLRCAEGAIICGRGLYIDDPTIIFAAGCGDGVDPLFNSMFWVKTDGTYGGKA